MSDKSNHPKLAYRGTERRQREWLTEKEIVGLFHELVRPWFDEQRAMQLQLLDVGQKAVNGVFLLTGDGANKGQLQHILENQNEIKEVQRLHGVELERIDAKVDLRHESNLAQRERDVKMFKRELQKVRRNQLWVVRRTRWFYDWCTAKDDAGRYSRARLAAFYTVLASGEETLRHVAPLAWHKLVAIAHAMRM